MAGNGTKAPTPTKQDKAVQSLRGRRYQRGDSWYNAKSRFGGTADPVIKTSFARTRSRLDQNEAELLYEHDWVTARVVDQPARDSTREWVTFTHDSDPGKAEALREEDTRLGGRELFEESVRWSRLHGGALAVIGSWDGGDPESPLVLDQIRNIMFAYVVDRWLAFPATWYSDPDDPKFGTPEIYKIIRITPRGAPPVHVHESRVIRFEGNPMPVRARVRNWGWGASVVDRVYDAIRNWGVSQQAAAAVVPSFITTKLKISNLQQMVQNQDWSTIQERIGETVATMAVQNIAMYGADEEIERMGTPITGLPELIDKFMQVLSGATDIPKSILFQSESGSLGGNAAESDVRNWYARISSYQETYLRPRIQSWVDQIGAPIGIAPGEIGFEFNSLWQLSEAETADVYLKTTQADVAAINAGLVDAPERITIHRMSGKVWNGTPPVIDTARAEEFIQQLEAEPVDLTQPEFEEPVATPDEEHERALELESLKQSGKGDATDTDPKFLC